ncbi:recombinase family protein [Pseudogracilibacillus auburnensis]|uniref:DNA invertase Pin-like site-specific DNA recombinase n=1 Tax=Pseudogracilibacillus auburnensis TaxID=1494959 RepID=A0A2V3VLP8_9BACI|nr:recombinase family protein [Pseudogracilibacillus auburnensis]MBO1002740.1 recombinase family protein [Pseudogracilibacillus auburnensis]PXW81708.1 DNA invertase Pin-like site-specific DNA recombinase [Pseudogracilibacillus auburnensis]
MLIGYARPLHNDLNCEQQIKILTTNQCGKLFLENHASAKRRIELDKMITALNQKDKVTICKLYAIADSTHHLVEVITAIHEKGAFLHSVKEDIDTSNHGGYSLEFIVKQLANFQSDLISEKTRKGIYKAKQKGISTGRPRKPDANVQKAILMYESKKYTLQEIRNETGISKSTLYRYLET